MEDALSRIAALASTLKEAELRTLIELTRRAEEDHTCRCSSRQIAESTNQSRRNVQAAIDSLAERGLISSDGGSATRASQYRLAFAITAVLPERGAPTAPPPPTQWRFSDATPGAETAPPEALEQRHPGVIAAPPPGAPAAPHPRARVENSESIELLDRVLRATPKKFDDATRGKAREWIYGYMRKFGKERDQHPPDEQIVAQFLSIAPWPQLENFLMRLFRENCEAGKTYAWFVYVALDRIHGIKGPDVRKRKAELQLVRQPTEQDLRQQIAAAATAKAMR